ncbi:hypothetical protein K737_300311 [Holospora undulata HU1]|uniref:Uncharacterized protein n=1 Tax=Holospora undulata HU1 TaxID=1321371 RepID=A0A061JI67_9PROT|nr:hypothetical protein K737_300311 [Holospora undulata HU1]
MTFLSDLSYIIRSSSVYISVHLVMGFGIKWGSSYCEFVLKYFFNTQTLTQFTKTYKKFLIVLFITYFLHLFCYFCNIFTSRKFQS